MKGEAKALRAAAKPDEELLAWENLASQPQARAFRQSLLELMVHPARFFRKMATTGGLHEPLAFFAVVLTAAIVVAFGAALAYFGLEAPDPEQNAAAYTTYVLPARAAGLLVALLPLTVAAACGAMVLLGTLFHLGSKPFGSRNWEGSVSVWLYSMSAALVPLVIALGAMFVLALVGYLVGLPWPKTKDATVPLVRWACLILCPVAALSGAALMLTDSIVGCVQAFQLDAMPGAAVGVSGLLLVAAAAIGSVWSFARWGMTRGLVVPGACAIVATIVAATSIARSRRVTGSA